MQRLVVLTWLISLAAASAQAAEELRVDIDFPGGSGEVSQIDQNTRTIRLLPTNHKDRGWVCWWYVKVSGITSGETVTLNVGEAPWATPDRAAFSLDNKTWSQTSPGQREGRRITYTQKVDGKHCWFAWGPPFVPDDARQLVESVAKQSPHATAFELCRTPAERPVPALLVQQKNEDVTDAQRFGIWIQARQHAWESGSSWVCRGLTEWLVSDDPRAEHLRRRATVTIVPIMDIDNVAIGAGGKNQKPHDHNRDWGDNPQHASVKAAMSRITAMNEKARFDMFVDLHNPGAGSRHPFYYITPRKLLTDEAVGNLDRFLAASRLEMTGPLSFKGQTQESGSNYDRRWRYISKNWVSFNTNDRVVAVTLETAWNTPHSNTDGYQTVGRQLAMAIERYFRTAQQTAE